MLRLCYLLFLGLTALSARAQTDTIRYQRPAAVMLKLAPLWLLDADPALAGGLEIRTGKRTSIQAEFGYGRPGWGELGSRYQHAGTWRIQTEMRFYRNRYRVVPQKNIRVLTGYPLGNYWAIEAYAKVLNVNHTWPYSPPVADPAVPAVPVEYRQTLIRRNSMSLLLKVGRQFGWDDNRHQGTARLLWDVYVGAGVRLINQSSDRDTAGDMADALVFYNRFSGSGLRIAPALALGIKLGFAL